MLNVQASMQFDFVCEGFRSAKSLHHPRLERETYLFSSVKNKSVPFTHAGLSSERMQKCCTACITPESSALEIELYRLVHYSTWAVSCV